MVTVYKVTNMHTQESVQVEGTHCGYGCLEASIRKAGMFVPNTNVLIEDTHTGSKFTCSIDGHGEVYVKFDLVFIPEPELPHLHVFGPVLPRLPEQYVDCTISEGTLNDRALTCAYIAFIGDVYGYNAAKKAYALTSDDLHELMCSIAPEGTYFGAHPGDGACMGFWK